MYRFPTRSARDGATFRTSQFLLFGMHEETGRTLYAPAEVGIPREGPVAKLKQSIIIS